MTKQSKSKSQKAGYHALVGNLGNELNQTAAQMFGKLAKAPDQTLNFLDTESSKHVHLRPEKMRAARTSLMRAGLITYKTFCGGTGGSYSVTDKGMSKILQYWPSFTTSNRRHSVAAKPATPSVTRIVVVPPMRTVQVAA